MEPVHGGRDDQPGPEVITDRQMPQWSPSTEDGTTGQVLDSEVRERLAAMEPVHGGRDDRRAISHPRVHVGAAMEPVHGGRDDGDATHVARRAPAAAMEPVHGGRDDALDQQIADTSSRPQWSPSTEDGTTLDQWRDRLRLPAVPQWSPSTEDGTTRRAEGDPGG